ncbi:MAG: hypothetical protein J6F30_13670 [Cellulosilyticum sp.]|nr:hypothetical protein [Cellulosilyticum sp.]
MKKQIKILIYTIMVISLITCGFVGFQRIQVENNYDQVGIAIKYSDILRISIEQEKTVEEVLAHYKELGVTNILVKETTVASVSDKDYTNYKNLGEVSLVEGYILRFNYPQEKEIKPDMRYIVSDNPAVIKNIVDTFALKGIELEGYQVDDIYFLEIGDAGAALTGMGLGFDVAALNKAADMGFNISLQLKSWQDPTEESVEALIENISAIKNVDTIYFADANVTAPTSQAFQEYIEKHQLGFIEFTTTKQKGFETLANATSDGRKDYKVVRLHTLEDPKVETMSVDDIIDRYDLALEERNNRVFLFKLGTTAEPEAAIATYDESITRFIETAEAAGYTISNNIPDYNLPTYPVWVSLVAGLASVMVFILFMQALGFAKTGITLGILGTLGYALLLLKGYVNLGCQLMALFGSVMFPTYAIIKVVDDEEKNIKDTILAFLKICLISFGGVLTIIGCLSKTNFAIGLDVFMGVKAAVVLPIALVLFYYIFTAHRFDFRYYKGLLDKKISYGSLILIGVLAVALFVYVSRTGNTGTATDLERGFRQFLDNLLGVRPRTKEFLISYPILLALLYYGYKEKYIIAIIFAVIGPISLVNTYAHIHTPVVISLIRSAYGILFGIIIGLIFIGAIKLLVKVIQKCQTQLK